MSLVSPLNSSTKRFLLKLIEMLGKGFRGKEHHDYCTDIEMSRSAYKILKIEVEYFVMRALLCLPAIVNTDCFLTTVREVLSFYQQVLKRYINSYASRLECLKAIEDSCTEFDHLKNKETCAYVIHFLHDAEILDGSTVLEFFGQREERNGRLLAQKSVRMLIDWLQLEATKNQEMVWSEEDDDKPLVYWLKRGIEKTRIHRSVYVWVNKDGEQDCEYKPLFIWVKENEELVIQRRKEEEEQAQQKLIEEIPEDEQQNENKKYEEDEPYEDEQYEDYEDDEDDDFDLFEALDQYDENKELEVKNELFGKDGNEEPGLKYLDGVPAKYLTKNFLKNYRPNYHV